MTLTVEGISLHGCEIVDLQHSDFLKVGYGCRCNGAVLHFALDKDRVLASYFVERLYG